MAVPLLDLTRQYAGIRDAVDAEVLGVLASQQFILGGKVDAFESAVCELVGCGDAVGMSSGTDAQLAVLMALGIGPGDAVVTSPYTFFATAGCIHRLGAETVFVDIRPDTFNLDPDQLRTCLEGLERDAAGELRSAKGNRVRLIVPVHLFGQCCEMDAITDLAAEFNLVVMEDAAQAMGAEYPSRRGTIQAGAIADWSYFSFFPAKNLGAYGDAGMATCRTKDDGDNLRRIRNHGMERRYFHEMVGGNFRIDALQAAILQIKLPHLAGWNAARRANAEAYATAFSEAGLAGDEITLPTRQFAGQVADDHIFHQYVVRARRRDELIQHLAAAGIGHGVYYPVPLHLQDCFAYLGYGAGAFPVAEAAARESLALPIFPELRPDELAEVVQTIQAFYRA